MDIKTDILNMLAGKIRKIMAIRNMRPVDIYAPLKIGRVNFYKAINTSNLQNKSFRKIVSFLGLELSVKLSRKKYGKKK